MTLLSEAKKAKYNMLLLDVLACKTANKQSFQNLVKSRFAQRSIDGKSAVTF